MFLIVSIQSRLYHRRERRLLRSTKIPRYRRDFYRLTNSKHFRWTSIRAAKNDQLFKKSIQNITTT